VILVIDNYDSFTWNLVQMLVSRQAEVRVVRNDELDVEAVDTPDLEGIILSPGPGRPEDAGICEPLLRTRPPVPVLGVCLGHQALGQVFGARIEPAPRLMHGKTSRVRHTGEGPFAGLPNPFEATRYHSLAVVAHTLPAELEPLAWSEDDTLMGMRHHDLPYWGVQFHPESILTPSGAQLMENFLRFCRSDDTEVRADA
jgi:anthranilate synthase component 2